MLRPNYKAIKEFVCTSIYRERGKVRHFSFKGYAISCKKYSSRFGDGI